ncbi:MAG: MFS transporter [Actinomycetes bacterium]
MRVVGRWGRGAGRLVRSGGRLLRKATHAQGAGASGLGKLIETQAVHSAGDAMVALALAGTLFFAVPVGEARGSVGLYLLLTMAPFALIAPVIGPVLDRFRHGRRYALAATFAGRAALSWSLAGAVVTNDAVQLYPSAFGILVLSKAYGVTRASAVPRLLPRDIGLVKANARLNLAGLLAALTAAGVAGTITTLAGPSWSLRVAVVVFAVGAVLAARLPGQVDHARGEQDVLLTGKDAPQGDTPVPGRPARKLRSVGPQVSIGLRANAAIRAFAGFLLFFLAFLLRTDPVNGLGPAVTTGIVVGAAAVGSGVGISLGALVRDRPPEAIVLGVLGVAALCSFGAAWMYGIVSIALVALSAGLAQSLGKLSLDALIQREIPENVRSSVFARAETLLQLSWVVGAGIGTLLPLRGDLGLGIAAAGLFVMLLSVARSWYRLRTRPPSVRPTREPPRRPTPR